MEYYLSIQSIMLYKKCFRTNAVNTHNLLVRGQYGIMGGYKNEDLLIRVIIFLADKLAS